MRKTRPRSSILLASLMLCSAMPARSQTALADQPVFTSIEVPGNLALALSVEFPTALGVAHNVTYAPASTYLGYFDPAKCYTYTYNSTTPGNSYFQPAGLATNHTCSGQWSGNFLNWATMQTIDPFRWALTGGYRAQDDANTTILERAWASGQGGTAPDRAITNATTVAGATPTGWSNISVHVAGMGARFRINSTNNNNFSGAAVDMTGNVPSGTGPNFDVYARVKVCDSSGGAGGLESNCVAYGSSYKPEGLIQQYSDRIRFSAFGYLTDSSLQRDGGVMRARMKFVGPTQPVPGSSPISNPVAEWSATTGIMGINPDSSDAATTTSDYGVTVSNSGVMNYLNKFGSITRSSSSYKTNDPVSELYYATQRYFRNMGNVPEWSNPRQTKPLATTADITTYVDGFPVITTWDDPIQYSCQKNFILGIGDVNTHADRNLPGATGGSEPTKPALVAADTAVNATTWTNYVGAMMGNASLASVSPYGGCCDNNGTLMAGLAYWANTQDIRPDDANVPKTIGMQTIQTYYLDVLESGFETNNQFYLAAKYGGFTVPTTFSATTRGSTDLTTSWWHSGDSTDVVGSQLRPDNYYTANRPDLMVNGLTKAFASIASKLKAFTTSFATASAQVSTSNIGSYAAQYDAKNWTGDLVASTATLDPTSNSPTLAQAWSFATTLGNQAATTGWNTGRRIVTYDPSTAAGVPFRTANVPSALLTKLDTSYRSGDDSSDYLNYLRGDRSQEQNSTVVGSSQAYRARAAVLGDIVNSKALPIGAPAAAYSEAKNPGYAAFKAANSTRTPQVFVGANDGMLHVVDGSLTGTTAGQELYAYIPSALFNGPTAPNTDGLAALGNPNFSHHFYVDATPVSADVNFGATNGSSGTDWRTIVVGGLGKGGKTVYALDATTVPSTSATESQVAGKVLWEYTNSDLGFTYGPPAIVKTKKYGWVVMVGSGYNNATGVGSLFILNARTGALLEKVSTGVGSTSSPAGLAYVQAYVVDFADTTADTVYAGDLLGNLWRFDLSATSGSYPAPTQLASLKDSTGAVQPITSRPLIMIQPGTNKRFVTVGTGRALATSDIGSSQVQSFYAIIDGSAARPGTSTELPGSVTYPIQRANLQALTNLSQQVSIDFSTKVGWYVDMAGSATSSNWRIISDAQDNYNSVIFTSTRPTTSDACNPSGNSRIYMINLGSGQSTLNSNSPYLDVSGVVTDINIIGDPRDPNQGRSIYYGTDTGSVGRAQPAASSMQPLIRLNWREVPLAN